MIGKRFLILLVGLSLVLVGCSSVGKKQNAQISRGIYATNAALKAGRYDLAQEYSDETARLSPPPKKRVEIKPILIHGKQTVILPSEFKDVPSVSIDSPALTLAIGQDKELQRQFKRENSTFKAFSNQTDSIIREKEKIVEKAEAAKPTFWQRVRHFIFLSSPFVIIGGLICLVVFVPASIPFILAVFNAIGRALNWILQAITNLIRGK